MSTSFESIVQTLASSSESAAGRLQFLKDGKDIALYGAGGAGRNLFNRLAGASYPVTCFVDRNAKQGQLIDGHPVYRPDDLAIASKRASTHIIVSIFNHFVEVAPILDDLRKAGWRSVTSMVDLFRIFPDLPQLYWLCPTQFYADKTKSLLSTAGIWADEKSRLLFENFVAIRATGDYAQMPAPAPDQYFPSDIPAWKKPLRLIDAGAYDGDTLREIEAHKITLEALAAFEPDEKNYAALVSQRQTPYFEKTEATLWPCGISDRTMQVRFSSGLGAASCISASGDQVIQCVAVDDALAGFAPTVIKMDIEGAEYGALQGAAKTIAEYRPGLAICVYHNPDDIWRIPALVKDWDLGYRFYLRTHASNAFDTVLYALP